MAEFKSRYPELGFYVNGKYRQFDRGRYVTDDKDEIAVLEKLADVVRVDKAEPKAEENAEVAKPSRKSK